MRYTRLTHVTCLIVILALFAIAMAAQDTSPQQEPVTAFTLQRLYQEGVQAYSMADYATALEKWQAALRQAQTLKNMQYSSQLLMNIGVVHWFLANYEQALEFFVQARDIFRELGNLQGEGQILNNMGMVYQRLGQHEQALDAYEQSLTIKQRVGDRQGEANALGNIGSLYITLGDYDLARSSYEQFLAIAQELGDQRTENVVLTSMGRVFWHMGQYRKALEFFTQAMTMAQQLDDRHGEGLALNGLGLGYVELGEYENALESYEQALAIVQATGARQNESQTLNNIGTVYQRIGQYEQALEYYERALDIERQIGHRLGESQALNNIGTVYDDIGIVSDDVKQHEQAITYYKQALPIFQDLDVRAGVATTFSNIGTAYGNLEQYEQAVDYYERALVIKRELGDRRGEGLDLNNIGQTYTEQGNYELAYQPVRQGLDIGHELDDPNLLWIAGSGLAKIEAGRDQPEEAIRLYEEALAIIESLRTGLSEKETKTSFMQNKLFVYDEFIALLQQLHSASPDKGYDRKALEIFERKQGRVFLEEMGKSGARHFAGVPDALLQREEELYNQLYRVRQQLSDTRAKEITKRRQAQLDTLEQRKEDLEAELQMLQMTLKNDYPDYYAIKYPIPVTVSELQEQVLQPDEFILIYHAMQESTVVWLVGRETLHMESVPVGEQHLREDISSMRQAMLYDWGTERGLNLSGQTTQPAAPDRLPFSQISHRLYNLLIPEAVRPFLFSQENQTQNILHIIPSDPLYALPFETLITKDVSEDQSGENTPRYLIEKMPINYLSSASLLKTLRAAQGRRIATPQYPLLAFAHPAYTSNASPNDKNIRALRAQFYRNFSRSSITELPETADEAKTVAALLNAPQESAPLQLREQASRANVLKLNESELLDDYQYLLFAMHGVLPGEVDHIVQSALVLSDDFLTMGDVFGLKLNADVVSLSACNTGRGTQVKGEGVVGLTRAFMFAGTPVVAVTLWSVESLSAKELDIGFFRALNNGMPPARALQAIKLQMIRGGYDPLYRSPYYWAPFVVFGDGAVQ